MRTLSQKPRANTLQVNGFLDYSQNGLMLLIAISPCHEA